MKVTRLLIVLALALAAFGALHTSAGAVGAFTYTSGFQVQNLEGAEATVTIDFYKQDGTVAGTVSGDKVPANGSKTYFPLPSQVGDGFNGSAVISSDKQVAAVTNILGNNGAAGASYVGASTGSQTVLLPLLMKANSGYNTWFSVQNTGTADANVTVTYSDGTTNSATVKQGSAATFDQTTENHGVKVFSAVVTANQPVAAVVIEESTSVMFAYNGFNAGATSPVMPLINANNSGYVTGVQIQNAGDQDTTVDVTYTPAAANLGTGCVETQLIPAKQSKTFALGAFASGANTNPLCKAGVRFVGAAQVTRNTANQPLTAIVNQLKGTLNGEAYSSFDPASATGKVVMPLIMDRNGTAPNVYYTGFNVMNVGGAATNVNCVFTNSSVTAGGSLAQGAAFNAIQNNAIAVKYVGSGTCTADAGGKIVGVVNELGSNTAADQLLVYEAISAP